MVSAQICAISFELQASIDDQLVGWSDMPAAATAAIGRVKDGLIKQLRRKVGPAAALDMDDSADLELWFSGYVQGTDLSRRREYAHLHGGISTLSPEAEAEAAPVELGSSISVEDGRMLLRMLGLRFSGLEGETDGDQIEFEDLFDK